MFHIYKQLIKNCTVHEKKFYFRKKMGRRQLTHYPSTIFCNMWLKEIIKKLKMLPNEQEEACLNPRIFFTWSTVSCSCSIFHLQFSFSFWFHVSLLFIQGTNPLLPTEMVEHLRTGLGSQGQVSSLFLLFSNFTVLPQFQTTILCKMLFTFDDKLFRLFMLKRLMPE